MKRLLKLSAYVFWFVTIALLVLFVTSLIVHGIG